MTDNEDDHSGNDSDIDSDSTIFTEPVPRHREPRTPPKKGRRKSKGPASAYTWPQPFPIGEGGPKTGGGNRGRKNIRKA